MKRSICVLCLLLIGCQSNEPATIQKPEMEDTTFYQAYTASSKVPEIPKPILKFKTIPEVVSDTTLTFWRSSDYYPNLNFIFEKGKVFVEFDGQCSYGYPISVKDKSITVLYDPQEDCTHDIGVKSTYGLKNVPQKGKPFFTLVLINDSTLEANYLYPEWTDKVNGLHPKYPCFVKRFYARTLKI